MKIDVGTAMVWVIGLPLLGYALFFLWQFVNGGCLVARHAQACGPGLLVLSALFFGAFTLVAGLAWYWRD